MSEKNIIQEEIEQTTDSEESYESDSSLNSQNEDEKSKTECTYCENFLTKGEVACDENYVQWCGLDSLQPVCGDCMRTMCQSCSGPCDNPCNDCGGACECYYCEKEYCRCEHACGCTCKKKQCYFCDNFLTRGEKNSRKNYVQWCGLDAPRPACGDCMETMCNSCYGPCKDICEKCNGICKCYWCEDKKCRCENQCTCVCETESNESSEED